MEELFILIFLINTRSKKMSSKNNQSPIWDDPDFQNAIKQIRQISQEDYPFTKEALETTESNLNELGGKLTQEIANIKRTTKGKAKAETAKEVTTQLEETKQDLDEQIKTQIKTVHEALEAKKSSLDYFTIAFMGKTKAGKSTLHSILTEQEWDSIGVGKQRTTRSNRIYTWNDIRIIDTPGIGAPGGKTDEETAESIINEADLIVFVVTNDSQQESEFQFLKLLKEKAKPLCILINVLKNFNDSRRGDFELKRFLKDPEQIFNDQEMQGHFNRIQGYAKKYYGNDYFSIVPVMLLAAQLSYQEKHQHHKEQLWEASQIENFLEQIRLSIVEQGTIRRSQNLLGSSVKNIEDTYLWAKEQAISYHASAEEIQNKQGKLEQDIDKAIKKVDEALKVDIKGLFQEIRDAVPQFAEDHWKDSGDQLNKAWEQEIKNLKFNQRLENTAEGKWNNFTQEVQHLLEELGKDLQFSAQLGGISGFDFESQNKFDFKNFLKIFGGIFGVAGAFAFLFAGGFIPGIIMTVGGVVMGLAANLFKSKAEIKKEAVEKISKLLLQQINKSEKEQTNQVTAEFRRNCNKLKTEVNTYLNQIIVGLITISGELQTTHCNLEQQIDSINCAYGKRIIDWSQKYYEPLTQYVINRHIVSVSREIGKKIMIEAKNKFALTRTQEELDSILQEKVLLQIKGIPIEAITQDESVEALLENISISESSTRVMEEEISQNIVEEVTYEISKHPIEDDVNELSNRLSQLSKLLKAKQWKQAEAITFDFLFNLIENPQNKFIEGENIAESYFEVLQKIDQCWRNYSKGLYGLTFQKATYPNPNFNYSYLINWYKMGVDRKQSDELFFPLYSGLYMIKLVPTVRTSFMMPFSFIMPFIASNASFICPSGINLEVEKEFLNIQSNWECLRKEHNNIMKKIRSLQQVILQHIDQENKKLVEIAYSTQNNYRERAKEKRDELEKLIQRTEQLFYQ